MYGYPQKPNAIMVLGSILTKAVDLESSLNLSELSVKPLSKDQVQDQTKAVRLFIMHEIPKSRGGRLKALLPVSFSSLASAGGGVSAEVSKSL